MQKVEKMYRRSKSSARREKAAAAANAHACTVRCTCSLTNQQLATVNAMSLYRRYDDVQHAKKKKQKANIRPSTIRAMYHALTRTDRPDRCRWPCIGIYHWPSGRSCTSCHQVRRQMDAWMKMYKDVHRVRSVVRLACTRCNTKIKRKMDVQK